MGRRIGSLFSGAGGLDLAVQAVFGGEVVWHAEIDKAASKVLGYRFPGVPNLGDISAVDWAEVPAVDVLCGGFPCQDVSSAGRRAGIKAGTRSGLWSVFADAIDALRPQWVVIENVRGLLSATAHRTVDDADSDVEPAAGAVGDRAGRPVLRAAGAVLGDLADLGYDAQWATVAAASVGAPHRRERVFIVAHTSGAAIGKPAGSAFAEEARQGSGDRSGDSRGERTVADGRQACGCGDRRIDHDWFANPDRFDDGGCRRCRCESFWPAPDAPRNGWDEGRPEPARLVGGFDAAVSRDGDVALLPTPGTMDDREKRTTHAGGNLTLQGAVVGVNPVDVERHSRAGRTVAADDGVALLPTPQRTDGEAGASKTVGGIRPSGQPRQKDLNPVTVRELGVKRGLEPVEIINGEDDGAVPVLPTDGGGDDTLPIALNGDGVAVDVSGCVDGHNAFVPVELAGTKPEPRVALLPTPCVVDRLATGEMTLEEWDESRRSQKERGVGSFGPRGDSLGAAILRVEEGSKRPDYSTTKARRGGDGHVELLPTPTAVQGRNETSGRSNPDSQHHAGTTLHDVVFKGEISSDGLLSTPQARDSKGIPKDGYNTACLPRDIVLCNVSWGKYEPAIRRWESLTVAAPRPTEPGVSGKKRPRLNAQFSEWLMGWPPGWVTDPDIGISRNDQLRIVGNGVCPQQAAAALRYLLAIWEVTP